MPSYATPGVYFEKVDQAASGISAVRTDITAFLGIAQRGSTDQPTAVATWAQFQAAFGGYLPNAYLAYSAKAFFDNGGQKLYVVRVAASAVSTTSSGPQASRSFSIVASILGFASGAVVTATQDTSAQAAGVQPADRTASAVNSVAGFSEGAVVQILQTAPVQKQAWRRVKSIDSATETITWDAPLDTAFSLTNPIQFTVHHQQDLLIASIDSGLMKLTWASPLGDDFDLTQSITFASGANAATVDLYDSEGNATLRITGASPGMWGDSLQVEVSSESLASTTSSGSQPTGGPASFVGSVTGFPAGSIVRVYQFAPPAPAVIGYRIVKAVDPLVRLLEWDAPLAPQFDVTQPLSFETVEFGLTVYEAGSIKETFGGLSLQINHPRYIAKALQSAYVSVEDLKSPSSAAFALPDAADAHLESGRATLTGGRDGVAALRPADFTGDPSSVVKRGLRALEDVDEVGIIAAPDILIAPAPAVQHTPLPQPIEPCCGPAAAPKPGTFAAVDVEAAPAFGLEDVARVQSAMIAHCEALQFPFAILDSPTFGFPGQRVDLGEVQSWRQQFDTEFAALYMPWVYVRDPLQLNQRVVRAIPPSGHVAGVYATTDLSTGVHKAPANTELAWAQGLTADIGSNMQGFLNPIAVNCLRSFAGRGLRVYGARTLSSDPAWIFVNVRRLISMIERALLLSLQWAVFEPNNAVLQRKVEVAATSFLDSIWRKGALAGNTAADAFYARCDASNNTYATTLVGELILEIGVAPVIPAEFVVFRIGKYEDTLEVTEV